MALPTFIIFGVARTGSTTLYNYLVAHPQVVGCVMKEPRFFGKNYFKGFEWYKKLFPLKLKKGQITGEASISYYHRPFAPERIRKHLPDVKLICLLRNPVERTYSHYQFRMNQHLKFGVPYWELASLVKYSIYVQFLIEWFRYFPRKQFLFIKSEDLFSNPVRTYIKVLKFLNLDIVVPEIVKKKIVFEAMKKKEHFKEIKPLSSELKNRLQRFFKLYNKALYELLGRDFGWDK